jgi:hypothetical protein
MPSDAVFESFTNIGQIFQYNHSNILSYSLFNDLPAHFMVNLLHTARLSTRDFLLQLFCRLRTVGLECAPFGKEFIPKEGARFLPALEEGYPRVNFDDGITLEMS